MPVGVEVRVLKSLLLHAAVNFNFTFQQVMHHRRHERAREEIAGHHRKHHRHRQWREQAFCRAGDERHRDKHDADAQGGDECGHGDLLGTVQNRLHQPFALVKIAVDVFDLHRRIIDENAHGQRHAAQRHHIQCLPQYPQHDDRHQNRKRDRNTDDERAAPRTEKQQDHQSRQSRGDTRLLHHAADRGPHEDRLIEQRSDLQFLEMGQARKHRRQCRTNAFDDIQRRGVPQLIDRDQRTLFPFGMHEIGLRQILVADVRHILDVNGGAVDGFDRQIVDLVDHFRAGIQADIKLLRAYFGGA